MTLVDWGDFLGGSASGDFVEPAGGRAAKESLRDVRARQKKVRNSFHGKEASAPLHRRACKSAYVFFAESMRAFTGVVEHHAFAGVYVR